MKRIRGNLNSLAIIVGLIGSLNVVHAQTTIVSIQSLHSASADDMAVMLQAMEETTPVAAESVPPCGTFYSALMPMSPPLPANVKIVFPRGIWVMTCICWMTWTWTTWGCKENQL